jgi:hypothetical protein
MKSYIHLKAMKTFKWTLLQIKRQLKKITVDMYHQMLQKHRLNLNTHYVSINHIIK